MSYYSVNEIKKEEALKYLKDLFPNAEANELNFCLFSTSGIHGFYSTIEDAEKQLHLSSAEDEESKIKYEEMYGDTRPMVTFLTIHPRIVRINYGNVVVESQENIDFLKKLRASSTKSVSTIGYDE